MAGGEQWYEHDYEYYFVEMMILIVLVCLALVFETCWHKLRHEAEHSYIYGDVQALIENASETAAARQPRADVTHLRLRKELVDRAGAEFMTLGFLAMVIFLFHNLRGFDWIVVRCPSTEAFHLPGSTTDWLHMAEAAHFKLFFGMVFYFILMWRLVNGSIEKIQLWEQVSWRRELGPRFHAATTRSLNAIDSDLGDHILWRRYFIQKIWSRLSRRPASFQDLMRLLDIDPSAENASNSFYEILDKDFCFSEYLALSVESGVRDSIQVHVTTWFGVIVLFCCFALLHCFGRVSLLVLMPFFSGILAIVLVVMRALVQRTLVSIAKRVRNSHSEVVPSPPGSPSSPTLWLQVEEWDPEQGPEVKAGQSDASKDRRWQQWLKDHTRGIFRFLQIVLFLNSYALAQILLDFQKWAANPESMLLYTSLFALLFVFLAYHLPNRVPLFLGIMAMPPHVGKGNLSTFCAVLLHRCKQEMQEVSPLSSGPPLSRSQTQNSEGFAALDETRVGNEVPLSLDAARDELCSADAPPMVRPTPSPPAELRSAVTAPASAAAAATSRGGGGRGDGLGGLGGGESECRSERKGEGDSEGECSVIPSLGAASRPEQQGLSCEMLAPSFLTAWGREITVFVSSAAKRVGLVDPYPAALGKKIKSQDEFGPICVAVDPSGPVRL